MMINIIGYGLVASFSILLLVHRLKSKKQYNRTVFFTVSTPIFPKAILIKQKYGFFERDIYVIKSHRKKESSKVQDACLLADQVLKVVEDNKQLVSRQVLEQFYDVKGIELGLQELQQESMSQGNIYQINDTLYTLKKSKLLLTMAFMEDLKKKAKSAGVLTDKVKNLLEFYPVFLTHLIENELTAVDSGPAVVQRVINRP